MSGPGPVDLFGHRTGLAVDLFLPSAPGHGPIDSADENRLYQSRSPAFAWMVVNARRFGFVNYPFEPLALGMDGRGPLPGVPISSLPQAGSPGRGPGPGAGPGAAPGALALKNPEFALHTAPCLKLAETA
ncbi:hypothetical protein CSW58_05365 [Caulobacter sp. B11]|uniref:M15 family metallopeptidase n=1 Tax=Caulobacter sp. B11 TaxID=2048899 RepID=UPI000C136D7A|nr:M15 family metallopeptidase [Caulobacter sp. B11]PHY13482.1 hypothetical protein CSW58_05365 [Caulobacter sp. B11]